MRRSIRFAGLLALTIGTIGTMSGPALAGPGGDLLVPVDQVLAGPPPAAPLPDAPVLVAPVVDAQVLAGPDPAVELFATCTITRRGTTTVWFGYHNTWDRRVDARVGASNVVTVGGTPVSNAGQVEQFQPGQVDRAFAVVVRIRSVATWSADVVDLAALEPGDVVGGLVRVQAANTPGTPVCELGTPVRSATPQLAGLIAPNNDASIRIVPGVNELRDLSGKLVRSSVEFAVDGVVSTCSAGGVPLPPRVLWGYAGPTDQVGGAIISSGGVGYAPLPPAAVVSTDYFDAELGVILEVQRSYRAVRQVVDPQRLWTLQEEGFPALFGLSSETVIADVTARCRFGRQVVSSSTVYWVDAGGRPFPFVTVTDVHAQTTRQANLCLNGIPSPCDVPFIGVGPGGVKFR